MEEDLISSILFAICMSNYTRILYIIVVASEIGEWAELAIASHWPIGRIAEPVRTGGNVAVNIGSLLLPESQLEPPVEVV